MLKKFDKYLSTKFSVDYWSDEGIGIAEEILTLFTDEDWHQLMIVCDDRDINWLVKCGETLGDHQDSRAIKVLGKLLSNSDNNVKITALDSINSSLAFSKLEGSVSNELKSAIEQSKSSSIIVNTMLDSLKRKLNSTGNESS
jgi:hypothetical protein